MHIYPLDMADVTTPLPNAPPSSTVTPPPKIVWGRKMKRNTYTLEVIPDSELLPCERKASPSRADRCHATPPLKGLQQPPPSGLELGRWKDRPRGWRPFYKRDEAFDMDHSNVWLPQVSTAMGYTDPPLKGRAWDPQATFEGNAGRLLDMMASILEPQVNATHPLVGREVFERPLMYNPISGEDAASTSASASAG